MKSLDDRTMPHSLKGGCERFEFGCLAGPVLKNPEARVRDHAYPKAKLGRAIRTERYRLVEWKAVDDASNQAMNIACPPFSD